MPLSLATLEYFIFHTYEQNFADVLCPFSSISLVLFITYIYDFQRTITTTHITFFSSDKLLNYYYVHFEENKQFFFFFWILCYVTHTDHSVKAKTYLGNVRLLFCSPIDHPIHKPYYERNTNILTMLFSIWWLCLFWS